MGNLASFSIATSTSTSASQQYKIQPLPKKYHHLYNMEYLHSVGLNGKNKGREKANGDCFKVKVEKETKDPMKRGSKEKGVFGFVMISSLLSEKNKVFPKKKKKKKKKK